MVQPQIELTFYGMTSGVYLISAIICFLVSYFSFKAFRMTSKKTLISLFLGFLILGIGFLSLAVPSFYVYLTLQKYEHTSVSINLINYVGFSLYYVASLIAYILLALMYLPEKIKGKLPIVFVPLWYANSTGFHIASIVIISSVIIQSLINSIKKRKLNSYLVTFGFTCLALFHLLILFTSFSTNIYLIANAFLIIGNLSLLSMLIRVVRG